MECSNAAVHEVRATFLSGESGRRPYDRVLDAAGQAYLKRCLSADPAEKEALGKFGDQCNRMCSALVNGLHSRGDNWEGCSHG